MGSAPDLPEIVHPVRLEGPAVVLRELCPGDLDRLITIFSNPDVTRYIPVEPITAETEAVWLDEAIAAAGRPPRTQYHLAIDDPAGGLAGTIRLGIDQPEHRAADIGYAFDPACWGRGIATEAVRIVLRFGFRQLGLHRISATHHPENAASGRVLVKAGLVYEGRLRDHMVVRGAWRDSLLYAALDTDRPDW